MTTMMRNGVVVVVLLVVVVVLGCSGMSGVRAQTFTPTNEVSAVCQITDFEVPEDQTGEEMACGIHDIETREKEKERGRERERERGAEVLTTRRMMWFLCVCMSLCVQMMRLRQ